MGMRMRSSSSIYSCYATGSSNSSRDNKLFLKTGRNRNPYVMLARVHLHSRGCCIRWMRIGIGKQRRSKHSLMTSMAASKVNSSLMDDDNEDDDEDDDASLNEEQDGSEKRGTILGAVSLIAGTSIGSGILALPQKTSPAGFIPSAAAITLCWLFLVIEALLLAEINVHLRKRRNKDEKQGSSELEVISLRTMAQETLGEWGGNLATVTYLFLAYTSMVAYTSKSGDVLSHLINLPNSVSGISFTLVLALVILFGGAHTTYRVNQWLTISMIGLLVGIEVTALSFGGWTDSMTIANWEEVPKTIPVIIFSLVYHDIAPVICAYLGGDLVRIRMSILLGSLVPLFSLLIWDGIALHLSPNLELDGIDPLDFQIFRGRWSNMLPVVEVFSLLAVGTSLIGTLLGFSQFFVEQLASLFNSLPTTSGMLKVDFLDNFTNEKARQESERNWLEGNMLAFLATSMAVFPSILISTILPDAFSVATDVAGGYCMTILFGVLPPVMAWAMQSRLAESNEVYKARDVQVNVGRVALSNVKPVLIGVGLLSCGIVMEQVLMDLDLVDLL